MEIVGYGPSRSDLRSLELNHYTIRLLCMPLATTNAATWIFYNKPETPYMQLVSILTCLQILSDKARPLGKWSTYLEVMHEGVSVVGRETSSVLFHCISGVVAIYDAIKEMH